MEKFSERNVRRLSLIIEKLENASVKKDGFNKKCIINQTSDATTIIHSSIETMWR